MNNFGRALRLALRYRVTFAASVFCALMVGVLWGGNFAAVYPFIEVLFEGRSVGEWFDRQVEQTEGKVAQLKTAQAELLDAPPSAELDEQRQAAAEQLAAKQQTLARYRWLQQRVGPYVPDDAFHSLMLVVLMLFMGTVVKGLFTIAHQLLVSRMTQLAMFNLSKRFYRQTLRMELSHFSNERTGELMSRFTYDMQNLAVALNECLGKLVREPLKMMACLVAAGWICWRLLVFSLLVAPLAAFLIRWLARTLKRANRRAMEEMSQIYNILEETFQGVKIVKAFTMERHERWRFHHNAKKFYHKSMRIARYDSLTRPLTELLGIASICLAISAGAYLVINQQTHLLGIRMSNEPLRVPTLMVFYGMLSGISDPFRKLSDVLSRIQRGAAAADRIFHMIDRNPLIVDPVKPKPLARHQRDLVIDAVEFHYDPGTPVLRGLSLQIPFGETIAIVGPNGCGKSTLVNLIPRFFDPRSGSVRLDGIDLRDIQLRQLRRQIGIVTQETLLFDDTVFNNIRYGAMQATLEQVIQAARQAHAHRFIEERLPQGYETMVGPRGSSLSGGQRQRIALARAILRDPAILILDEATSQIDLESEQVIQKVLQQFTRNRTTVIISHRMATLALADRIVVMDSGRILDVGTHDELLRRCDLYGRLNAIHFKEIA